MDFQAARAYDEWAELLGVKTKNIEASTDWISAAEEENFAEQETSVFQNRPGEMFEVDEIVQGLEKLNGMDITVLDVKETFGLSDYFVIVTAKSVPHMKKMMDTVARALRARKLPNIKRKQIVEGRDCEDWMCVDCENIIVHAFDAEAREAYDLQGHWENVRPDGTNPLYEGKSLDDLQEEFPPYIEGDTRTKERRT
jgi:ribosome-associated protein